MHVRLELDGDEYDLWLQRDGETIKVEVDGQTFDAKVDETGRVTLGNKVYTVDVSGNDIIVDATALPFRILDYAPGGAPGDHRSGGARGARIKPPMPGKIVSINIKEGDEVEQGQVLLILEAMKMQNEIVAPAGGTVKKVHVTPGQNVEGKDLLVEIE